MAATPRFKIVSPQGEYIASCKYAEECACLMAFLGDNARVYDRKIGLATLCWLEGATQDDGTVLRAGESYDECAERIRTQATGAI